MSKKIKYGIYEPKKDKNIFQKGIENFLKFINKIKEKIKRKT